jgi:uncharacterized membrane protein affecting hemolysin expression
MKIEFKDCLKGFVLFCFAQILFYKDIERQIQIQIKFNIIYLLVLIDGVSFVLLAWFYAIYTKSVARQEIESELKTTNFKKNNIEDAIYEEIK